MTWDSIAANRADPYVWVDPDDAVFVSACRDALKIERKAWEACHAERQALLARVAELEAAGATIVPGIEQQ